MDGRTGWVGGGRNGIQEMNKVKKGWRKGERKREREKKKERERLEAMKGLRQRGRRAFKTNL